MVVSFHNFPQFLSKYQTAIISNHNEDTPNKGHRDNKIPFNCSPQ